MIAAAREAGIGVIGELELGWRLGAPTRAIVVTGSNGKTTTVELVGHLHRTAGLRAVVVGNVGTALSSLVGSGLPEAAIVVCEASSFQLEDTQCLAPDAGRPAQPGRGPPRPPRHVRRLSRREARGLSSASRAATVAVAPEWARGRRGWPGDAERVWFGSGPEGHG